MGSVYALCASAKKDAREGNGKKIAQIKFKRAGQVAGVPLGGAARTRGGKTGKNNPFGRATGNAGLGLRPGEFEELRWRKEGGYRGGERRSYRARTQGGNKPCEKMKQGSGKKCRRRRYKGERKRPSPRGQ